MIQVEFSVNALSENIKSSMKKKSDFVLQKPWNYKHDIVK